MKRFAFGLLLWSCLAGAAVPAPGAAPDPASAEPAPAPAGVAPAAAPAAGTAALPAPPYARPLRAQAQRIVNGPDFHQPRQVGQLAMRDWLQRWLRPDPERKKAEAGWAPDLALLARAVKLLLAMLLAGALAWLLWRGWRWLAPRSPGGRRPAQRPVLEAQSLALLGDELPARVSEAARLAWRQGDAALALSLLYRGAVRSLALRHAILLPASATEGECLRLARRSGKAVVNEGFAPIVRAWMALAYAGRAPADLEALLRLYRRCFEAAEA